MSWAAHQFEVYAVQAHLPKKMKGKVSFWAIFLGDFTPDFLSKFWVYGFTINGTRYGSDVPHQWHRGFPGMGFTHTLFFGAILTLADLVLEEEPRLHGRLHPRLRRACADRHQRLGRRDAAVPAVDLELHVGDVGVCGDDRRREVPRRGGVLLVVRAGDGRVLADRRAVLVAGADPRALAARDRAARCADLGVVREVVARARPARAVSGDVLLRACVG